MMDRLTSQSTFGFEFRKLWAASGFSNLADGIGLTAAPLLAAALSRDPALVAGLVFAQRIPWFLFSLLSGALVDRLDRRLVIGSANLFRAFLLGLLGSAVVTGRANLLLLYMVFFFLGSAETLIDNAALAILPAIIPRDRLEQANGRLFATQTVANELVGPLLGGLLYSIFTAVPFLASSGSFVAAALLALHLRGQFHALRPEGSVQSTIWADIQEGMRWFWNHRLLRTLAIMSGTFNFFWAATTAIFVLVAQDVLGLNDIGFGLVLASGAFGGIVGGLVADHIVKRLGTGRVIFVTNLLPGVAYVAIALTTNPFVVGAMFTLVSFANMVGNVILISLRQSIIPDHLLGRVASGYRLFVLGALPIGALFGGGVARAFGLTAPYWVGGVTLAVMAFAWLHVVNDQTVAAAQEQLP
jgi:MFS family permease